MWTPESKILQKMWTCRKCGSSPLFFPESKNRLSKHNNMTIFDSHNFLKVNCICILSLQHEKQRKTFFLCLCRRLIFFPFWYSYFWSFQVILVQIKLLCSLSYQSSSSNADYSKTSIFVQKLFCSNISQLFSILVQKFKYDKKQRQRGFL